MQKAIREEHVHVMDSKDREKFSGLFKDKKLLRAEQPGNVIARLALDAPKEMGGNFLRYVNLPVETTNTLSILIHYQLER